MSAENRLQWMKHKAGETIAEFDISCLPLLPQEVQVAIKGLVAYAFERGYNWGFNEGRSTLATGREPTYSIPEQPVVEIVLEPRDVA